MVDMRDSGTVGCQTGQPEPLFRMTTIQNRLSSFPCRLSSALSGAIHVQAGGHYSDAAVLRAWSAVHTRGPHATLPRPLICSLTHVGRTGRRRPPSLSPDAVCRPQWLVTAHATMRAANAAWQKARLHGTVSGYGSDVCHRDGVLVLNLVAPRAGLRRTHRSRVRGCSCRPRYHLAARDHPMQASRALARR